MAYNSFFDPPLSLHFLIVFYLQDLISLISHQLLSLVCSQNFNLTDFFFWCFVPISGFAPSLLKKSKFLIYSIC